MSPAGSTSTGPVKKPAITLTVTNLTAQPLQADGQVHIIRYAVNGIPGDMWLGKFNKLADVGSIPIHVDIPAKGTFPLALTPEIPETFGGYVLVVDLGAHGQRFGCSVARTLPADGGRVRIPAYALDIMKPCPETFYLFKRLGVKGARMELGATLANDPQLAKKTEALDTLMKSMNDAEISCMLTVSTTTFPQPLGLPRPFLDEDNVMQETKADMCSLPANDPDFKAWCAMMAQKYGWPNGPVNAMELWNEPWEGISISGWGGDMLRYRDLYTAMAEGVESARGKNHSNVLIGGTCSSSNTSDKLFPDGSDTFLKWLDFTSLHYQPFGAVAGAGQALPQPQEPRGPDAGLGHRELGRQYRRTAPRLPWRRSTRWVSSGRWASSRATSTRWENARVGKENKTIIQAWSTAASVAATQKFIGQRKFRELLFKNGLPWILVFDGRPDADGDPQPEDGTVVVVGDFSAAFDRNLTLFRDVYGLQNIEQVKALKKQLAAATDPAQVKDLTKQLNAAIILTGGTLTLSDSGGKFGLKDFYGNAVAPSDGKISVPLNGLGYFLRGDGKSGSFKALLAALKTARIEGYEPISVKFHDFTAPVGTHPALHLTLTNILNRPSPASCTSTWTSSSWHPIRT